MTKKRGRDPVSAISEAEATGRTAEIFADIREVMRIPLITSIWRTLADIEGGLENAWDATRPLFLSGQPESALHQLVTASEFPAPSRLPNFQLASSGVDETDYPVIDSVFDAYNRSNGLNLFALTALVGDVGDQPIAMASPSQQGGWPQIPHLMSRGEIDEQVWESLERIRFLGADSEDPSIATLWRHLAHWPGLLNLIYDSYMPMHNDGSLKRSVLKTLADVQSLAGNIQTQGVDANRLPEDALLMIENYVNSPNSVARMVTLGFGVKRWLNQAQG